MIKLKVSSLCQEFSSALFETSIFSLLFQVVKECVPTVYLSCTIIAAQPTLARLFQDNYMQLSLSFRIIKM